MNENDSSPLKKKFQNRSIGTRHKTIISWGGVPLVYIMSNDGDDDDRCIQGRGNGFISELGSHSVALADAHHQGLAMWVNMVMMMMVVAVTVVMMMVTVVMVVMMVPEMRNVVVK